MLVQRCSTITSWMLSSLTAPGGFKNYKISYFKIQINWTKLNWITYDNCSKSKRSGLVPISQFYSHPVFTPSRGQRVLILSWSTDWLARLDSRNYLKLSSLQKRRSLRRPWCSRRLIASRCCTTLYSERYPINTATLPSNRCSINLCRVMRCQ